MISFIIGSS